jgi:hypothetical protein
MACVSSGQAFNSTNGRFEWYEVLLDHQADVSIVHPRLLSEVRESVSTVSGLAGEAKSIPYEGKLKGFFDCKGSNDVAANVLCGADVEDMYEISYLQGESFTVHMPDEDLVFHRRDKFYVADMRAWADGDCGRVFVNTEVGNESEYSKAEVVKARKARELINNSGFSSEREALALAEDGNITGVPVTGKDVRRSYDIYGKTTAGVRGRRTSHRSKRQLMDVRLKAPQSVPQTMYGDVMFVKNQPFLACLTEPLGLFTLMQVDKQTTSVLGEALQSQISTIRSRGFEPSTIYLDPQRGLVPLQGAFPGVEVDVSGAGDHMDKIDSAIKHSKEIMRSVHAGLPWKLARSMTKDLAYYGVSRKNLKSTPTSVVCPRVRFTGRKPDYKKELGLGFGDYVECYDPACKSNRVESERTQPCIALYPTANANGSWWFMNIKTKRRVRRTNWEKMVTTDLVIAAMNAFAEEEETAAIDEPLFEEDVERELEQSLADADDREAERRAREEIACLPALTVDEEIDDEVRANEVFQEEDDEDQEESDAPLVEDVQAAVEEDRDVRAELQEPRAQRQSLRLSGGRVARPKRYQAYHTSYKKGLRDHGRPAYIAIVGELKQLLREKKAIDPVHRGDLSARQIKKVIRSIMFLKTKFDGMGVFEKIKARLVANGAMQDKALYPDNSSPTAMMQSVMMCLAVAAKERRKAAAIDIGGAYLNAERTGEEVIMELEPGLTAILKAVAPEVAPFVDEGTGKLLVRLDRALYGCLDSAKLWYEKLTSTLREMGYVHNEVDPCVMNKMVNGKQITLVVYVDDILALSEDLAAIEEVVQQLKSKFGEVKYSLDGDLSYLGMHIRVEGGVATVSMTAYLDGVLEEHGITGVVTTPATAGLFDETTDSRPLSELGAKEYHTIVAKLLYLGKRARPDILLTEAYLCTKVKAPTEADRVKLDRLLKYLNGTKEYVLVLDPGDDLAVTGYIDASFGCHPDGKSHSGLVVTVGGATVLVMSSKQKIVTKDSTESELVALSDKTMSVLQCADFMLSQGHVIGAPSVKQDNTSTISLVTKGGGQYRSKYMKVRQAFVKERVDCGEIKVEYLSTKMMLADAMTKPLQGELFRVMTSSISGMTLNATGVRWSK